MLFMNITDKELQIAYYDTIKQIESYNNIHGLFYKIGADNWISKEFLREAHKIDTVKQSLKTEIELMFWNELHSNKRICNVCSKKISCMLDKRFEDNNVELYIRCAMPSLKSKEAYIDKPTISLPLIKTSNGITGIMLKDYANTLITLVGGSLDSISIWKHIPEVDNKKKELKTLAQSIKLLLHMQWESLYTKPYHPRKDVIYLKNIPSAMPLITEQDNHKKLSILTRLSYDLEDYKIFM